MSLRFSNNIQEIFSGDKGAIRIINGFQNLGQFVVDFVRDDCLQRSLF